MEGVSPTGLDRLSRRRKRGRAAVGARGFPSATSRLSAAKHMQDGEPKNTSRTPPDRSLVPVGDPALTAGGILESPTEQGVEAGASHATN